MKKLLISIAVVGLLLSGCCPKREMLIRSVTPFGVMSLHVREGTFDEKDEDREQVREPEEQKKQEDTI